jgi:hypothetical protein
MRGVFFNPTFRYSEIPSFDHSNNPNDPILLEGSPWNNEFKLSKILDIRYNQGYTNSMKTGISIPDKVFRSADALAKRLGITRSELYANAITEFLSKHQSRHVTARLDAVYAEEDSSLSPNLIQLQAKSLAHEEW